MIFSTKALIWTVAMGVVGFIFYLIFKMIGLKTIGLIIIAIFGVVGFVIGTCKMPKIGSLKVSKYTEGENLDDIIIRGIKFKLKKNKIYVYAKEEKENDVK